MDITSDHQMTDTTPQNNDTMLGLEAEIRFTSVGNKSVKGKVDTGASVSCLHAENITVNDAHQTVSFHCEALSDNVVTMDLAGTQKVHSADGGGNTRPTVKFDIEINGIPLNAVVFNLNDRSDMDTMVLIGQNVLKAGNFQVDINKNTEDNSITALPKLTNEHAQLAEVLQGFSADDVETLMKIVRNMKTIIAESVK